MESIEKKKQRENKESFNNPGPCIEKKCSVCCNPVKVHRFFSEDKIPVNKNKEKIWKKREELLMPEEEIDITKLETYDCMNFDKSTGRCLDYDNRPKICRRVSCVDKNSTESINDQYKKLAKKKFIAIKD